MGLVDRLIALATATLPSRRAAAVLRVSDDGLGASAGGRSTEFGWGQVTRVVAMRSEQMAAGTDVLVFGFNGGESLIVAATDPAYRRTLELAARHLPGSLAPPVWQVMLMAAPLSQIEVFRRG